MDVIDPYIERYGERLYGLCRALCASRADADDLYQETWLRAVRSFARYDPARPFAPWITRICVNVYRSQLRRRALSPVYNRFATTEEKDAALAAAPAPERAEYGELYDAVARLPERLRVAVILYYFRDMDVAAAARAPPARRHGQVAAAQGARPAQGGVGGCAARWGGCAGRRARCVRRCGR